MKLADLDSMPKPVGKFSSVDGIEISRRVVELDGLRGLMTIAVVLSHYFGELKHGLPVKVGWIAVDMFFVLSGFLIGKLILDKMHCENFFSVFYVRRFCRIVPAYMMTVLALSIIIHFVPAEWFDTSITFPLWSYLTFTQTFFMISTGSIGNHWLAPTWTLAFEEHFYLLAPSLIVFTPRQWLIPTLVIISVLAFVLRVAIYEFGWLNDMAALVLLPARADLIVYGVLAAVAVKSKNIQWSKFIHGLRIVPAITLTLVICAYLYSQKSFAIFGPLLMAIGCTSYLLCIYLNTPEAKRFKSKTLQYFGNNGYCIYLTHLPVLGLMHGIILGSPPDIETGPQWLVTLTALPICIAIGRLMTKLIEEPLTAFGRRWRWSSRINDTSIHTIYPGRPA